MILLNPQAILPQVLVHKQCGYHVEQTEAARRYMPDFYTCARCNAILHKNNVEARVYYPAV